METDDGTTDNHGAKGYEYEPPQGMMMFTALNAVRQDGIGDGRSKSKTKRRKNARKDRNSSILTEGLDNICFNENMISICQQGNDSTDTNLNIPLHFAMCNSDNNTVIMKTEPVDDDYQLTQALEQDKEILHLTNKRSSKKQKVKNTDHPLTGSSSVPSHSSNKAASIKTNHIRCKRVLPTNQLTRIAASAALNPRYKCLLCKRFFWNQSFLKRHRQFHTGQRPFKCLLCVRSFYRAGLFIRHTQHHRLLSYEKSNHQLYSLKRQKLLRPSIISTDSVRNKYYIKLQKFKKCKENNTCTVCEKQFNYKYVFRQHKVQSDLLLNSNSIFVMDENMSCSSVKLVNGKLSMQKIKSEFPDNVADSSLIKCLDNSVDQKLVMDSIHAQTCKWTGNYKHRNYKRKLTSERRMDLACSICDRRFSQNSALNNHMRLHTGEKPHKCQLCEKKFTQASGLNNHIRTHMGIKPYSCTLCDKSFRDSTKLNNHLRTHTGEKPFQCSICRRSFCQSGDLVRHMRVHTGEKPYECPYCQKLFSENSNLNKHIRSHTGDKRFKCNICEKSFTEGSTLNSHMRIHTGDRPFACSFCDKTFTQSGDLHKHIRIHTGLRPYICAVCPKTFIDGSTLKRHIRAKHVEYFEAYFKDRPPKNITLVETSMEETAAEIVVMPNCSD